MTQNKPHRKRSIRESQRVYVRQHKDKLRRDMLNNPGIYQSVIDRIEECMSQCIHVSDMPNAVYDVTDFHNAMMGASIRNGQVAGCAESVRRIHGEKRHPTGEWMRHIASKSQLDQIMGCFEELASMNISLLHRTGILKEGKALDAAIDMHLIPSYDKEYGEELVHFKSKSRTFVFERYIPIRMRHCENLFSYACVYYMLDLRAELTILRMRVCMRLACSERKVKYHVDGEWEYSAGSGPQMIRKEVIK